MPAVSKWVLLQWSQEAVTFLMSIEMAVEEQRRRWSATYQCFMERSAVQIRLEAESFTGIVVDNKRIYYIKLHKDTSSEWWPPSILMKSGNGLEK